jgi:hypothetical protein
MAHKELIQEPKYAMDAMADTARERLQMLLPDAEALHVMYSTKAPTTRKVIKLLECQTESDMTKEQSDSLGYLKRFIKGLDDATLKKFLRYFTGADMICVPSIEVSFNRMVGFGRAPQAHTCGPLIELPSTYGSYPELRQEIQALLDANYLKMDIV